MNKKIITTNEAPDPVGPYNQAIKAKGQMVFVAGQIPLHPESGEIIGVGDIILQTEQVMANLQAILKAAKGSWENVVKTTVYLSDLANFAAMNEVYGQYFSDSTAPARATVEVARLPKDVLVEIDCIAVVKD